MRAHLKFLYELLAGRRSPTRVMLYCSVVATEVVQAISSIFREQGKSLGVRESGGKVVR